MKALYISGSPRKNSNTDYLLKEVLSVTGGEFLKIADYHLEPCRSCWTCLKSGKCAIDDDMTHLLNPRVLAAEIVVLGTPVYFNTGEIADGPEAIESARKLGDRLIELGALLGLKSR